jgi:hypothetical protein
MIEDIIDEKDKHSENTIYSRLSLVFSFINIIFIGVLISLHFLSKMPNNILDEKLFFLMILLLQMSCLIGAIMAFLSYFYKEILIFIRELGIIFNICLFAIIESMNLFLVWMLLSW